MKSSSLPRTQARRDRLTALFGRIQATCVGRFVITWGPALAVMTIIFALSSRSSFGDSDWLIHQLRQWFGPQPWIDHYAPLIHRLDELDVKSVAGHLVEYALLGVAMLWGIGRQFPGLARPWLWAWTVTVLYGVTDEWHQSFVPGRNPDWRDVVLDGMGAALAIWLWVRWAAGRKRAQAEADTG